LQNSDNIRSGVKKWVYFDPFDESGTLSEFHNFKRRYGFDRSVAGKESRGQGDTRARRVAGKIRYASVQLSVDQCNDNSKEENTLTLEQRRLEEVLDINTTIDTSNELETKRQLLQILRESRVEGAVITSRVRWHESGEKNSSIS